MSKKFDDNDDNDDEIASKIAARVTERFKKNNFVSDGKTFGPCRTPNPSSAFNKTSETESAKTANTNEVVDREIASMIDHTLLVPEATQAELKKVCDEAKAYHFATVCVNSCNIPFVAKELTGSGVLPIAVVGFPLGAASSESKAFETKEAIREGAREIDMVVNIGALKSKNYKLVFEDILTVVKASGNLKVKVILETSKLTQDEKIIVCALAKAAGAAFVKTSTGFGGGGATVEDITLMRKIVGPDMEVKASGGVRTIDDARAVIKAGANRIGASSSVAIVTGKVAKGNY